MLSIDQDVFLVWVLWVSVLEAVITQTRAIGGVELGPGEAADTSIYNSMPLGHLTIELCVGKLLRKHCPVCMGCYPKNNSRRRLVGLLGPSLKSK